MDNNDIYSNMSALSVLVITMVVNVFIQIKTGVVSTSTYNEDPHITNLVSTKTNVASLPKIYSMLAIIYIILLLVLLVLYVCSCIAPLTSRKDLEFQYKNFHDEASREIQQSSGTILTSERLREYVTKHWIMARSGSSQFVFIGYLQTTCASGVICVSVTILHLLTIYWTFEAMLAKDYDSDYSWSVIVIVILQLIGMVIGTIAPLCRCFTPFISFDDKPDYLNVFKVQSYWTSKLYDWRGASIGLPFHLEAVIQPLKRLILTVCIGFQVVVVVVCKIIALSLYYFSVCALYFFHHFKWLLNVMFASSDGETTDNLTREEVNFVDGHEVKFGDALGLTNRTREGLLKSAERMIKEGEDNKSSIDLLEKSTSKFYGVGRLNYSSVRYIQSFQNCWSLQVVTLATVACSIPEIDKKEVNGLKKRVNECLAYVMVVDESLDDTSHNFVQAVRLLWEEVSVNHKWLGKKLPQLNTAGEVVEWFKNIAEKTHFQTTNPFAKVIDEDHRQAFKDSMKWASSSILDVNSGDGDQHNLSISLSSIIADTIAACLTNIPQVIIKKCNPNVIEEREDSVKGAALLLGETKQIIEKLQEFDFPNIDPSDMPFLNKWCASLRQVC